MQAAGLPSNILIIYLQTYKNKVSKVVILVVIFPDGFDYLRFLPLIVSKALINLHKPAFFQNAHRGSIFRKADSVNFFDIEFLCHGRKKGFYSLRCVPLPRKLFCNMIADFPGAIINLAKLNLADIFAVICDYWIYERAVIAVISRNQKFYCSARFFCRIINFIRYKTSSVIILRVFVDALGHI